MLKGVFIPLRRKLRNVLSPAVENPKRPPRRIWLELEELESRALLSASAWVAQPNLTIVPSATTGNQQPFTPSQIRQAYAVPSALTGSGETIAIVDAYSDPTIRADLATFDRQFGLPAANLTIAQPGGPAAANSGWAAEIALDVEWAHAIAPGANILLVEAPSNSLTDLLSAVRYASVQPNVVAVSMSWGGGEFQGENAYDSSFTTPGVTYVASAGDSGAWYGPQWPASSPNVLAVGGTSLSLTSSNAWASEQAWNGGGGGYSSFESEPAFQKGVQSSGARTSPDVSYNANPNTGFYVYDSYGEPGWLEVGGTSAGTPQWAAIVTLADQQRGSPLSTAQVESTLYSVYHTPAYFSDFHDITSGSNGYLARSGYDAATGLGSPQVNAIVPLLANIPRPSALAGASAMFQKIFAGSSNGNHPNNAALLDAGGTFTLTTPNTPTGTSATASVGASPANENGFPFFGLTAQGSPLALGSGSVNLAGLPNAPDAQAGTTFGASGWRGASDSWRLSSHGLHGPTVDQLASDLADSLFEVRNRLPDSDSGGDEAPAVVEDFGGEDSGDSE